MANLFLWKLKKTDLDNSAHAKLLCVNCHKDFNPEDMPHKAIITPVNCSSCHSDVIKKHSFHPQMANVGANKELSNCKNCHGTHKITKVKSTLSALGSGNATEFCGRCHAKQKAEHLTSLHQAAFLNKNIYAPTCDYCHQRQITKYWIKDEVELKEKQQELCLSCHEFKENTSHFFKTIKFANSNHGRAVSRGKKEAASCIDCHGIHSIQRSNSAKSITNKFNVAELCRKCHISIFQEFMTSPHGISLKSGNKTSPGCINCHNEHYKDKYPEISDEALKANLLNRSILESSKMIYCAQCHTNNEIIEKNNLKSLTIAHNFLPELSKHFDKIKCVECHSANSNDNMPHNIFPAANAKKDCNECHKDNSIAIAQTAKFDKNAEIEKTGSFAGRFLSSAGIDGLTRNMLSDSLAVIAIALLIIGLIFHGALRMYFNRKGGAK